MLRKFDISLKYVQTVLLFFVKSLTYRAVSLTGSFTICTTRPDKHGRVFFSGAF